jgi:hypothetical protein
VQFEQRGIASALIVTDVFEGMARQMLRTLGYPHVPVLVTPNPVVYLSEAEIHQRIDTLLDGLVSALCKPAGGH